MNTKYFVVALALAGVISIAPAMAGSTNVNGGKKNYDKNFKVVEHIGDTKYSTKVSGSASYTYYHEDAQENGTQKTTFGSTTINSANPSKVNALLNDYKNEGREFVISGRTAYNSWYNKTYGANVARDCGVNIKSSDVTSSTVRTKVFDGETFTRTENRSNNLIFVGDVDDLANAYVAQGSYTRNDVNDKYYHYEETTVYQVNVSGVVSPIILDLDGDGKIEASNGKYMPHKGDFTKNAVMFDFYGNGFPVACEWVGTNDGLLCVPNEDGSVLGTNLFGTANGYDNGFEELAALDVDGNGSLEGAELETLMVWTDTNHNGVADKGELNTLESLGITSIGVKHNNMVGSFVRNGKTFKTFDWWPSIIDCRKMNVAAK